jgi:hypothetical protein
VLLERREAGLAVGNFEEIKQKEDIGCPLFVFTRSLARYALTWGRNLHAFHGQSHSVHTSRLASSIAAAVSLVL